MLLNHYSGTYYCCPMTKNTATSRLPGDEVEPLSICGKTMALEVGLSKLVYIYISIYITAGSCNYKMVK
jgi:hypothetical protein